MTDQSASTDSSSKPKGLPWWFPIWEFLIHVLVGTSIFVVIAMPAVALDLLIEYARSALTLSEFTVSMFVVAKYALLIVDVSLFVFFLLRTAIRTARSI